MSAPRETIRLEPEEIASLKHEFVDTKDIVQCQVLLMIEMVKLLRAHPEKVEETVSLVEKAEDTITGVLNRFQRGLEKALALGSSV